VLVDTDAEADLADGVRLATMHRVKGLEFPRMLLAGVHAGTMPLTLHEGVLSDDAAREDHVLQERRLLFVAATRARDELVVTGYGDRSPLLDGRTA
jgi:superfamily I DNA/RNA helicase